VRCFCDKKLSTIPNLFLVKEGELKFSHPTLLRRVGWLEDDTPQVIGVYMLISVAGKKSIKDMSARSRLGDIV
jgi:hypothetical protein